MSETDPQTTTELGPDQLLGEWSTPTRVVYQLAIAEHFYLENSEYQIMPGLFATYAEGVAEAKRCKAALVKEFAGRNYHVELRRRGPRVEDLVIWQLWAGEVAPETKPEPVLAASKGVLQDGGWATFYHYPDGKVARTERAEGEKAGFASAEGAYQDATSNVDSACLWMGVHEALIARVDPDTGLLTPGTPLWRVYNATPQLRETWEQPPTTTYGADYAADRA